MFFGLWASVWPKNRAREGGGPPGLSPGSATAPLPNPRGELPFVLVGEIRLFTLLVCDGAQLHPNFSNNFPETCFLDGQYSDS